MTVKTLQTVSVLCLIPLFVAVQVEAVNGIISLFRDFGPQGKMAGIALSALFSVFNYRFFPWFLKFLRRNA